MNPIFAAALDLQAVCRREGWRFCFIGAVAADEDWIDIEGVVGRQAGRLDAGLIFDELDPLLELKGAPEAGNRLRSILRG